jgi:hypothetical protein
MKLGALLLTEEGSHNPQGYVARRHVGPENPCNRRWVGASFGPASL